MRHVSLRGVKIAVAALAAGAMMMPLTACGGDDHPATADDGKPIVYITVRRNVTDVHVKDMPFTGYRPDCVSGGEVIRPIGPIGTFVVF